MRIENELMKSREVKESKRRGEDWRKSENVSAQLVHLINK
jgi:hypothetical protein